MFGGWQCTAAAENVYIELFHVKTGNFGRKRGRKWGKIGVFLIEEARPRTFGGSDHVERSLEYASDAEVLGSGSGAEFRFEDSCDATHEVDFQFIAAVSSNVAGKEGPELGEKEFAH